MTLKRRRQTFRSSSVGLQPTDKLRRESRDPARRGSRVFKQWQCLADPGSVVPRRNRPRLFAGVSRECQRAIGCCAHNQSHCRRGAHPAQGGGLAAAGFRCLRGTLFSRAQPARGVRDELVRRGHRGRADRSALGRRLIVNVLPRYLKSLLGSVAFPASCLERQPGTQILCVTPGF